MLHSFSSMFSFNSKFYLFSNRTVRFMFIYLFISSIFDILLSLAHHSFSYCHIFFLFLSHACYQSQTAFLGSSSFFYFSSHSVLSQILFLSHFTREKSVMYPRECQISLPNILKILEFHKCQSVSVVRGFWSTKKEKKNVYCWTC